MLIAELPVLRVVDVEFRMRHHSQHHLGHHDRRPLAETVRRRKFLVDAAVELGNRKRQVPARGFPDIPGYILKEQFRLAGSGEPQAEEFGGRQPAIRVIGRHIDMVDIEVGMSAGLFHDFESPVMPGAGLIFVVQDGAQLDLRVYRFHRFLDQEVQLGILSRSICVPCASGPGFVIRVRLAAAFEPDVPALVV